MSPQPLRELRISRLMSVRELAREARITPKTLTDIEYGRRKPTYETMRNVCEALQLNAHDVFEFGRVIEMRAGRK